MDNKNDNNFFNRNPILVFIIFSIVVVILFRLMVGESSSGVNGIIDGPKILNTQRVAYSDIKRLIKDDNIASVKITNTTIEAVDKSGNYKYMQIKIPAFDENLIPYVWREKNIPY